MPVTAEHKVVVCSGCGRSRHRESKMSSLCVRCEERRDIVAVLRMRAVPQGEQESRNLWGAVLDQAINDMGAPTGRLHQKAKAGDEQAAARLAEVREEIRETARWFASHSKAVGAFLWICDRMELEPDAVRQRALFGWAKAGHGEWRNEPHREYAA